MPAIIAGMAKLTAQLNAIGLAFTVDDLAEGALVIAIQAENNCPVGTGHLKSTIFVTENGNDVEVGFSADYASYVEFGHYTRSGSYVPAQPFLRSAIDTEELAALSAIVDSVEKNMRDITK